MSRTIKVDVIERKYKDRQGNDKVASFKYAKVAERVKEFRADYPKSKVITKNTFTENGETEFDTYIWRDRDTYISGDLDSADSTGTARGSLKNDKDFEKLETISVGRALALLGYLASGEVASFEEMEKYDAEQTAKKQAYIQEQVDLFDNAKTLDKLKQLWVKTDKTHPEILVAKDKRKAELETKPKAKKEVTK